MENPFQSIEERLGSIESLLITLNEKNVETDSNPEKEELLTVQEAAAFLSLSVPTIYSKVNKGELPVMKRSKRLYFSNYELMDYLKQGRIKTNSELDQEADSYLQKTKR
jgi:excisionase family DNA binding protein